ncbi:MAG: hypothetical protein Q8N05_00370, partial [Bacteroidota bacterium]|nr:hypothetical protein [Bacteroidota bacterium]
FVVQRNLLKRALFVRVKSKLIFRFPAGSAVLFVRFLMVILRPNIHFHLRFQLYFRFISGFPLPFHFLRSGFSFLGKAEPIHLLGEPVVLLISTRYLPDS